MKQRQIFDIHHRFTLKMVQSMQMYRSIIVVGAILTHRNAVNDDEKLNHDETGKESILSKNFFSSLMIWKRKEYPNELVSLFESAFVRDDAANLYN